MENNITSLGRLATVIDCGTIHWERKVNLWFQLADIDVEPQDKTLPIYKQFVKTPYGGNIIVWSDLFNSICDWAWCNRSIDWFNWLVSCVWKYFDIAYHIEEYRWKPMYVVDSISKTNGMIMETISRWVETRSFIFSDSTTKEDVDALWFDSKHVKSSDEYNMIIQKIVDSDDLIF